MALKDSPGFEVWAHAPNGKKSHYGLRVYAPTGPVKFEHPHIEVAVIEQSSDGDWLPMMVDKHKTKTKYNPRIFCYIDALPDLILALTRIHRAHSPNAPGGNPGASVRRVVEDERSNAELDAACREMGEFK